MFPGRSVPRLSLSVASVMWHCSAFSCWRSLELSCGKGLGTAAFPEPPPASLSGTAASWAFVALARVTAAPVFGSSFARGGPQAVSRGSDGTRGAGPGPPGLCGPACSACRAARRRPSQAQGRSVGPSRVGGDPVAVGSQASVASAAGSRGEGAGGGTGGTRAAPNDGPSSRPGEPEAICSGIAGIGGAAHGGAAGAGGGLGGGGHDGPACPGRSSSTPGGLAVELAWGLRGPRGASCGAWDAKPSGTSATSPSASTSGCGSSGSSRGTKPGKQGGASRGLGGLPGPDIGSPGDVGPGSLAGNSRGVPRNDCAG
mmetsp:Transcript_100599/g.284992  ORF Transcript_100599/g.284992 Transcript_100599/m.284992 type:complete len:314 (-) Transcript_100599:484-1425(-)